MDARATFLLCTMDAFRVWTLDAFCAFWLGQRMQMVCFVWTSDAVSFRISPNPSGLHARFFPLPFNDSPTNVFPIGNAIKTAILAGTDKTGPPAIRCPADQGHGEIVTPGSLGSRPMSFKVEPIVPQQY